MKFIYLKVCKDRATKSPIFLTPVFLQKMFYYLISTFERFKRRKYFLNNRGVKKQRLGKSVIMFSVITKWNLVVTNKARVIKFEIV